MGNESTKKMENAERSETALFKTVSRADKKRICKAANIVNGELDEWLRHKPAITQIIKLVQENPGLFFLSTNDDALNAALDFLQSEVKKYRNRNK